MRSGEMGTRRARPDGMRLAGIVVMCRVDKKYGTRGFNMNMTLVEKKFLVCRPEEQLYVREFRDIHRVDQE